MIDLTDFNAALLSTDVFAQDARYIRQGYPYTTIPVILDADYVVGAAVTGAEGIGTSAPVATCRTSDAPNAAAGDTLIIGTTSYRVVEVQPDGYGVTMLLLSKDEM